MRVASYWCVHVLNPVHARVVNGAPFSAPSIFSSMKRPPRSGWIVEVPLVVRPGVPGWNQNVISTSQAPAIAVRRACSGAGAALASAMVLATSTAIRQMRNRIIGHSKKKVALEFYSFLSLATRVLNGNPKDHVRLGRGD